jgi:alginate O-acetyltransferase complex protein AlgI
MLHWTDWCEGFSRFIVGLGKKVLIANQVSIAADAVFALPVDQLTCAAAWTGLMAYGLQIYFDFSGYSDMAIGLGRMMGFSFPENFNYPYWATSMREFWRRWHISLSSWFRDYVYFPLGGNRLGVIRTIANLTLVFALCGLWHGASWNFLIWGLYQGVFLAAERLFGDQPFAGSPVSRCFGRLYTVLAVSFGWVLFRSETFIGASRFFRALMDFSTLGDWASIPWRVLSPDVILPLCAGLVGATPIAILISERIEAGSPGFRIPLTLARGGVLIALLWFALIAVAAGSYNPFIYYRF